METTEGGVLNDAVDGAVQNSEFGNEIYNKIEQEITFEDALKNNANAEEIPYLDVQPPLLEKEVVHAQESSELAQNGSNDERQNGLETGEVNEPTGDTVTENNPVPETTDNEALVEEILAEPSQQSDELDPETEAQLLKDEEEIPRENLGEMRTECEDDLHKVVSEESQRESRGTTEKFQESIEEGEALKPEEEAVQEAETTIVEELEEASGQEAGPSQETTTSEDIQYVIEEPSCDSVKESSKDEENVIDISEEAPSKEVKEVESIVIEEVSTDGSLGENPPVVVLPDERLEETRVGETETTSEEKVDGLPIVIEDESSEAQPEALKAEEGDSAVDELTDDSSSQQDPLKLEKSFEQTIEEASIIIEPEKEDKEHVIIVSTEETEVAREEPQKPGTSNETSPQTTAPKKPVSLSKMKIPHHVLGTNIEKPVRDLCSNGRVPPKPRLGVKIPYRNLTSQIVSKQEIEKVILDRAKAKQQQPPVGGDLFFTKKLTQRLARKILPEERKKYEEEEQQRKEEQQRRDEQQRKEEQQRKDDLERRKLEASSSKKPQQDDADLLAILEGDPEDVGDAPKDAAALAAMKEWEKEVALKQLEQMPPRRRGRSAGLERFTRKNVVTYARVNKFKPELPGAAEEKPKENTQKLDNLKKADVDVKPNTQKLDAVECREELDIEPHFSTNSVVKTYTRKRRPAENVTTLAKVVSVDTSSKKPLKTVNEHKDQKVSIDLPPNAYVTKSSRVIKRKVIWDPDEAASPIRSYKSPKGETPPKPGKIMKTEPKSPEEKPKPAHQKSPEEKVKVIAKVEKIDKAPIKKVDKAALLKKPKRLTEVDRLLMDEGAVNMLYDVKNTEDQTQVKKKRNVSTISLDKAQRELLNKTNEIKNDLQISSTRESPKSLRKKEGMSITPPQLKKDVVQPGLITRKKSKDSNRSSVHSPPASPAYAFPQNAEASRIIRRHSSSSFSSGDEVGAKESEKEEATPAKSTRKKSSSGSVEQKLPKKQKVEKESVVLDKNKLNEEMAKNFNEVPESVREEKSHKYGECKTLAVKVLDKMVHVIMNVGKKDALLNLQVLNELTVILNQIRTDSSCNAVVLTSSSKSFCHGLDYKTLVIDADDQRKKKAEALAKAVQEFLETLASFPKFLAAAVEGAAVGLGVTMLPLFDMVLASERAVFSAPYICLGCAAEGGALLGLPQVTSLAQEMLYGGKKVAAMDAVRGGLVTTVLEGETFKEEVLKTVGKIAEQSQQGLEAVKKQLKQPLLASITSSFVTEAEILVQQWVSEECQKNFGKYKIDKD